MSSFVTTSPVTNDLEGGKRRSLLGLLSQSDMVLPNSAALIAFGYEPCRCQSSQYAHDQQATGEYPLFNVPGS